MTVITTNDTHMGKQNLISSMPENASGEASSSTNSGSDKSSVDCPYCDSTFTSKEGMWSHKGQEHPNETREIVECDWCGSEIERPPSAVNDRNFCSDECSGKWRSENTSGEQSWHWKGGFQTLECEICGTGFKVPPARVDEARFCSESCHGEWVSEEYQGENNPNWVGGSVEVECDYCGNITEKTRWRVEDSPYKHIFCSNNCREDWISENRSGKDSYSYNGGRINHYGPNWTEKREEALERDDHTCQDCGINQGDVEFRLEVHHIRPIRSFDDKADANELTNLITLCRSCHVKWEGLWLRPDSRGD
jgi:hypothetical protein